MKPPPQLSFVLFPRRGFPRDSCFAVYPPILEASSRIIAGRYCACCRRACCVFSCVSLNQFLSFLSHVYIYTRANRVHQSPEQIACVIHQSKSCVSFKRMAFPRVSEYPVTMFCPVLFFLVISSSVLFSLFLSCGVYSLGLRFIILPADNF